MCLIGCKMMDSTSCDPATHRASPEASAAVETLHRPPVAGCSGEWNLIQNQPDVR